jgi:hypothetical protein
MKEKILAALKNKFRNLGFGDKAFDGVADYLSQTVTDETAIETAISGVENLLRSFQGDIDTRVTAALAKQKAELEKKTPPGTPPAPDPTDISTIVANAVKSAVEPLQQRIEGYEKRESQKTLSSRVLTSVREGLKSDAEKKGFDAWVKGRAVNVEDESKLDEVISTLQTGYTEFRQEMINQGVIPDVPKDPSGSSGELVTSLNEWAKEKTKKP